MRYLLCALCLGLLAFAVTAVAADADDKGFNIARGTVDNLDDTLLKLKASSPDDPTQFQVTSATRINAGSVSKLADLKKGEVYTIIYSKEGKNPVQEINNNNVSVGKVQSNRDNTLTIKSGDSIIRLMLSDKTRASANNKPSKVSDIKEGDQVTVAWLRRDGDMNANYIVRNSSK